MAVALTGLTACSAAVAGQPTGAAAPAVPTHAPPSAHVEFTNDPRGVSGTRAFDLTGGPDSTCDVDTGSTRVAVRDSAAAKGMLSTVAVDVTLGAPGAVTVSTDFNSDAAGTDYDTSYVTGDGAKGQATAGATMAPDGRLVVSFDARSWDGATYRGTVSCLPQRSGPA